MEERKWEDMNADCLAKIFDRVELESKLQAIPLVCKPWYQALRNPSCWEHIVFAPAIANTSADTELIKIVVDRSQRRATSLTLPDACNTEVLLYVSEELPDLKMLSLSIDVCIMHRDLISSLIVKWKNLESLILRYNCINEIIEQICVHLPKFGLLDLRSGDIVNGETAAAIVSHVPKLKVLIMKGARLKKENLLLILQGCKELEYLDVRNCIGFKEDDEEILRFSTGIKMFQCEGSKEVDEFAKYLKHIDAEGDALADAEIDVDYNIFGAIGGEDEWDLDEDWHGE